MSQKTLKIGIIGAGGIVRQRHLPNLKKIEGVEIVAVSNRRRESAEKVAQDYQIPQVIGDWKQLIAMPELDIVWIGTTPYMHEPLTLAALDAGKHVFCQARMAMNYQQARSMYQRSQKTDRVTMLCPPPHGMKGDQFVRKLISEGFLGKLYHVRLTSLSAQFADPALPVHWRQEIEVSGYNILALGIYNEVLNRWVGYTKSVQANNHVFIPTRTHPEIGKPYTVRIPDSTTILTELENDAQGVYHLSGVARFAPSDIIEMYGGDGTLVYHIRDDTVMGAQKGDKELRALPIPKELEKSWTVEQDFIDAVREKKPVSPNFYEGLRYMEFVEAVSRAHETGQRIRLPLES
jgi:predicted dehydrogenase